MQDKSAQEQPNSLITIEYQDLLDGKDLTKEIAQAYGYNGLGLLTVKNIPKYDEYRLTMLPLARKFAQLPEDVKEKYVDSTNFYQYGWSHGKEKFNGKPDFAKGSYYGNPKTDEEELKTEEDRKNPKYTGFKGKNIWPSEIPEIEQAFKNLGNLLIEVGSLVARQCDNYQKQQIGVQGTLEYNVKTGFCKSRLLHYFPINEELFQQNQEKAKTDIDPSIWCGWHNDTGSLTGLSAEMYIDGEGNIVEECPDKRAGLYIQSRKGDPVHLRLPKDQMAFQIGEAAQVMSGGVLIATPHMVKSANVSKMSRQTQVVFMEPTYNEPLSIPEGIEKSKVTEPSTREFLPKGIPQLEDRLKNEKADFGEFLTETFKLYH